MNEYGKENTANSDNLKLGQHLDFATSNNLRTSWINNCSFTCKYHKQNSKLIFLSFRFKFPRIYWFSQRQYLTSECIHKIRFFSKEYPWISSFNLTALAKGQEMMNRIYLLLVNCLFPFSSRSSGVMESGMWGNVPAQLSRVAPS